MQVARVNGAVRSFQTRRLEGIGVPLFDAAHGLARQIDTHDVLPASRAFKIHERWVSLLTSAAATSERPPGSPALTEVAR